MMAFCRSCGNEVRGDARFCGSCGAASGSAQKAVVSSPVVRVDDKFPSTGTPTPFTGFRTPNRSLPVIVLISGIVGLALVTAGYIQYSRKPSAALIESTRSASNHSVTTNEEMQSGGENENAPDVKMKGQSGDTDGTGNAETVTAQQNPPASEQMPKDINRHIDWTGERFPETRLRLIAESEISSWSFARTRYAINEMYARYGLDFRTKSIEDHFRQFPWYKPQPGLTTPAIELRFSEFEMKNMKLLAKRRNTLQTVN